MKRFLAIACLWCLTAVSLHAQRVLSGTVSDGETGESLAGATVIEKGTANGTFTDDEGKYTLKVSDGDVTLVFRFVGYKTVELVGGGDVALESDAVLLDEEVITALGISREKKSLGYAVQNVGGEDLTKSRDANVVNSLSGKIAGVNVVGSSGSVGSSSRITIRGNSSISGNNQPLFVINGVPVDNSTNNFDSRGSDYANAMADINPDDIENVTVLKGPNAAALYGSRAQNGAILITTKKGNEAGVTKGFGISYSMNVGFDNPLLLPDYQDKFGQGFGGQFGYYDGNWGGSWDGMDESFGPSFDVGINENDQIDNDGDGIIDEAGEGANLPQYTGTWGIHDGDGFDNNYDGTVDEPGEEGYSAEPWKASPDNIKNFFQTGVSLTNNVAITSRKDNSYARFSYTNLKQTGMVPNTDLMRNTFDVSYGGSIGRKLSMEGNIKYIRTDSKNRPGIGYNGDNVLQQSIWFGRQVDWADLKENWESVDAWGNNYNWNHSYQNNPYFTMNKNLKPMNKNRVLGYYKAAYQITPWLSAQGRMGTDFYNENRKRMWEIGTKDYPNGRLVEEFIGVQETNMDFLLTANKSFGENFDFTANLGANKLMRNRKLTDYLASALVVPGVFNVGNASGSPLLGDFQSRKVVNSLYGSASFGYGRFLYLDLTARNDYSSTLPAGNNSYFYPSATVGFLLSEAVKLPAAFNLVKLRGGWANVGNDTDPYQLQSTFSTMDPWNGLPTFIVPATLPNSELRPERTTSLEAGLDLVLFENRVALDVTYYNGITRDQIIDIAVAPSSGATKKVTNAGSVRNSGLEIMANFTPVKTKDFQWDLGVNWAKNNSTVVELAEDVDAVLLGSYWGLNLEARVGEPFGTFSGNAAWRDDAGNLILDGGLPQIDPESSDKVLGTITPDWVGGITTRISWKGLSLNALVDMRQGSDLFSVTYMFGRYAGVLEESLEGRNTADELINGYVYDGVMNVGTEEAPEYVTNDVAADAADFNSSFWVNSGGHDLSIFDASFVKLREMSLSYQLPASLFEKIPVGGINLGVYGRNLAILHSNTPHVDPESAFGSQLGNQGFEFGALPSARTFGFSLKANF